MTSLAISSSAWASRAKVGLTLAFLVTQMSSQAAPAAPTPPDPNDTGPVIVSTDPVKKPSGRREVKRGPVKPETHPTKPQQQVRKLR
ncbi:MAG: hypothetical protein ABIQ90_05610 [Polaromonas sp.]